MWRIAKDFNISLSSLISMNPGIQRPWLIYPYQQLNVTCDTAATSGENLLDLFCHRNEQMLLLQAMHSTSMSSLLTDTSVNATLFAPTNQAFRAMLEGMSITMSQLLEDKELLMEVLSYHVVPDVALKGSELRNTLYLPTMLTGQNLTVVHANPRATVRIQTTSEQLVKVIKRDFTAASIMVHVVNEVLIPVENFGTPCTYTVQPGDSLWQVAKNFDKTLEQIINSNPEISDVNAIMPGTIIRMPC